MANIARSRAWVEVDTAALRSNFEAVRAAVGGGVAIIPMVKADGYGLGAERVVRALEPAGPWGYGVATAVEGASLRETGVERPILVLGPLPPDATALAAEAGLTASISEPAALARWAEEGRRLNRVLDFHAEIDTGIGRAGMDFRRTGEWAPELLRLAGHHARWTGVFTHFHDADAPDRAATDEQWRRFRQALDALPMPRDRLMVHGANSAAALRWPEYAADAVRPGIFLYGGRPWGMSVDVEGPVPRAVVAVRARIVLVRDAEPGRTVGYGATHVARERERWATLSIGYGDGLRRSLGNRGSALVRGRRVPLIGRTSMDMSVVDVSSVPDVQVGDVATLIGADGAEEILLDEVAAEVDTIGYEILTGLTQRLPRVEQDLGA